MSDPVEFRQWRLQERAARDLKTICWCFVAIAVCFIVLTVSVATLTIGGCQFAFKVWEEARVQNAKIEAMYDARRSSY